MAEPVRAPFTAYIGGMAEEITEGYARVSVQTGPQHADASGCVHSGLLTSLMDSVIGIALGRLRGEGAREREGPHATIDMSTNFYAYATPGDEIICEGRVTRLEESVAFGDVEARRASDGEVLARAHLTFVIQRPRSDG